MFSNIFLILRRNALLNRQGKKIEKHNKNKSQAKKQGKQLKNCKITKKKTNIVTRKKRQK